MPTLSCQPPEKRYKCTVSPLDSPPFVSDALVPAATGRSFQMFHCMRGCVSVEWGGRNCCNYCERDSSDLLSSRIESDHREAPPHLLSTPHLANCACYSHIYISHWYSWYSPKPHPISISAFCAYHSRRLRQFSTSNDRFRTSVRFSATVSPVQNLETNVECDAELLATPKRAGWDHSRRSNRLTNFLYKSITYPPFGTHKDTSTFSTQTQLYVKRANPV